MVRVLLDAGADIDRRGPHGTTAPWRAANGDDAEMCRALLAWGADPSLASDDGYPPWGRARGTLSDELRIAAETWISRRG
jgi:hypothetical protein